ncbi:hypothetical protein GCM10023194_29640 [Planotetraspora phitsanulokensis]|uniref:SnoaL-like domain-containing protein n=1 Tax=Planotetraspora phitsanulokensis TaxID=575192 RepID=A0A8J3XGU6_9ACTN|nr:hypothetical protein [Planotetraspora phitsanulokensis]GII35898.1 hypothetical protein Pph01_09010 [Planotetraspora phitsanulokensis]
MNETPAHTAGTVRILGHEVDVTRATPDVVRFFESYFEAKSGDDVDALMAHFSRESVTYGDATVGWVFRDWKVLYDQFADLLDSWPEAAVAYPTRIIGDFTSAVVFFVDSPEMFGREVRAVGTVDFQGGRAVRWVDHWDGRSLTVAGVEKLRVPVDRFPADFGEQAVGETAAPALLPAVQKLAAALTAGDAAQVASLFDTDVILEDTALHTLVTGQLAVQSFLSRTLPELPYGQGVSVRHVVGGALGGAFEWSSRSAVPLGTTALELGHNGLITRVTSTWDGSLWREEAITEAQLATLPG